MTFFVLGRIAVSLRQIVRELKRMNDLSEARYPVEMPRVLRKTEISHPTARQWSENYERDRAGIPRQ